MHRLIDLVTHHYGIKKYCLDLAGDLGHDLYHEVILYLCEKSDEQKDNILNSSWYLFVIQMIYNTYYLPRSPFNKKFRNTGEVSINGNFEVEDDQYDFDLDQHIEGMIDKVMVKKTKLKWYDAQIFEIYMEGKTMRDISRMTTIPYNSIRKTIKDVKIKLK